MATIGKLGLSFRWVTHQSQAAVMASEVALPEAPAVIFSALIILLASAGRRARAQREAVPIVILLQPDGKPLKVLTPGHDLVVLDGQTSLQEVRR